MRSDFINTRLLWTLPIWLLILFLVGCAGNGDKRETAKVLHDYGNSTTFPVPPEIQSNVDFWRHVYGVWSRGEVALHDQEHMGVIYEVVRIPGPIQAGYSTSQKAWLDSRTSYHRSRVKLLEEQLRAGQTLSPSDRELLAKFEQDGGAAAIYGASERIRAQRGLRERFKRGLEISGRYDPAFREIMRSHGVPEDLAYLPHVESSFQTNAKSSVGAGGVWQFMPATGKMYMTVNDTIDERYDPILAADGAARYLAKAHQKLNSWPLAITSYNHGQGGMANAKAQYGNDIGRIVKQYKGASFGFASRNFYSEFVAAREVASHPERYFTEGFQREQPWPHDRLVLRNSMPATHVAQHYGTSTARLADLNLHWSSNAREGRASLPAGCTIWLPAGSMQRVAHQPSPVTVMMARAEPKAAPTSMQTLVAMTPAAVSKPIIAKVERPAPKPAAARVPVRYHVVQPQETLYRVAMQNGLSVDELRRLNKMRPDENHIQTGQKLKVGI